VKKPLLRISAGTRKRHTLQSIVKYRRAAPLVLYWQNDRLVFHNYASRTSITAEPLTCSILQFCRTWRTFDEIGAFLAQFSAASIRKNLNLLCQHGVLESSDATPDPRRKAMEAWASWNPAAGFFHFSTKDLQFDLDPMDAMHELQTRVKRDPMPLPLKSYPHARKTKLPRPQTSGEFPEILKSRRTWRIYGGKPVPLDTLAEILHLTFGIQGWANVPALGRAAMKTSPSCGCLHPIEAYVHAKRVKGLAPGLYHYNAERHELEWLRKGLATKALMKHIGNQWWFAKSAFLVLMTAVFARTRWKYDFPRVYRGILLEAGHLCQTFCLTATWRGLAPFSTIAYTDTQWEKWLGIDGVSESLLYIAGAGTRPTNLKYAHMRMLSTSGRPSEAVRQFHLHPAD